MQAIWKSTRAYVYGLAILLAYVGCSSLPHSAVADVLSASILSEELSLTIFFEQRVDASENSNFTVELTIQNEGLQPIKILPWGTPWEAQLARDIFKINLKGSKIFYTGAIIKRRAPELEDYVEIAPGEMLTSVLGLDKYYELESARSADVIYAQDSISILYEDRQLSLAVPEMGILTLQSQ